MNRVDLVGRVFGAPNIRYHNSQAQAKFAVSINRPSGKEDIIPCVTYDMAAEMFYGYLEEGSIIEVSGFLASNEDSIVVVAKYIKPIEHKEQDPLMRGINYARPVSRITS